MRFLRAGQDGLLVELADLEAALALLDRLHDAPPPGLAELIPGARTVLLRFDPALADAVGLAAYVRGLDLRPGPARSGALVEIPVTYDGEDLKDVARLLGWTVAEVIRRHSSADFTVAFTGFAPGFAYMSCSDPGFDLPRRSSPRVRIPAGSLALAGRFSGVYPSDSPGGWQLIGRTPMPMWDLARPRAALLAPGDRVVFRDTAHGAQVTVPALGAVLPEVPPPASGPVHLSVIRVDRPVLFEDAGRPGQAAQGLSRSGALDRGALRRLNRMLGNPAGTAALELVFGGLEIRAEAPVTLALTGAPAPLVRIGSDGFSHPVVPGAPFALDAGDRLSIGAPSRGVVSYLGLRGGFAVTPVLGSAARDTLARLGPEPVTAGGTLYGADLPCRPLAFEAAPEDLPAARDVVTLDIVIGPRDDWFTAEGLARLTGPAWQVTPEISRTGKRLLAPLPLERRDAAELLSEATVAGAIQVPHSGQPVLFLADHPLTGGYPVIACVAARHLDLAAQIPPGAFIRFRPIGEET